MTKLQNVAAFALATLLLTGCGGGVTITPPPQAAAITVQPLRQTVPVGETATFTVTATGTAPISYQWSDNGVEIEGANSATYTTTPVSLAANGSTSIGSFDVTVSNSVNSVTSKAATLTAGPRSPKAGDLRYLLFRQIDTPGLFGDGTGGSGGIYAGPSGFTINWANNAVGTPLGLGSSYVCGGTQCEWPYAYQFVSTEASGLDMYYRPGTYSTYVSDLGSYSASNVVFTSLDLESAADAYAVSWVQTSQTGGFDSRLEPAIAPGANQQGQIQAQADVDGKDSRVITAVSFDASGSAILISYGWTGDTTTRYDTQTAVVPASEVKSKTAALAGQGYIISAFGGNDTYGYILVGMRVHGDTLPRAIGFSDTPPYFTPVVYLDEDGVGFLTEQ